MSILKKNKPNSKESTEQKNSENKIKSDEDLPLKDRKGKIPEIMVKKLHEHLSHVATLRFVCFFEAILLVLALSTIAAMPSQITLKYSPQLRDGATLKLGEFPKAAIMTDVEFLWIAINKWDTGGLKEANHLLWRYQNFISPSFKAELEKSYEVLNSRGSLNRRRAPHSVPGQIFEYDDRVTQITENSWVVYLDIILEESADDRPIRKPTYRYEIMVERYETNTDVNPIGLRLTGFRVPPVRIKD